MPILHKLYLCYHFLILGESKLGTSETKHLVKAKWPHLN